MLGLSDIEDSRPLQQFIEFLRSRDAAGMTLLQFEVPVEVILDRPLPSRGHDQNLFDTALHRLFDHVLNRGLVDNRQHFLGLVPRVRKKSCPEARSRNDRFHERPPTIIAFYNALHNVITHGNRSPATLARIAVIGMGYTGLGTSIALAKRGHTVTCVDTNPEKVTLLSKGRSPLFEPGFSGEIAALESKSSLHAGDFGVCVNPEFLREGHALEDSLRPSHIVIGERDRASGNALLRIYAGFACPKVRTSVRIAEAVKYATNAFLATKVTFANELANICIL